MIYIIVAILAFGVLIAIHELGHFTAAKLLGVRVNEFSIGMGPLLLSRQGKETMYSLRLLPIGGYCAMEGEDEDSDDPKGFGSQPKWKRLIILAAGSLMNLAGGVVIVVALCFTMPGFGTSTNTIGGFLDGFPLEGEEGLMVGDRIVSVNGAAAWTFYDLNLQLNRAAGGETMDLVIQRGGERIHLDDFPLTPQMYETEEGSALMFGLEFVQTEPTVWNILKGSVLYCFYFVELVWYGLCDLISGAAGLSDMAGPIGIVDAIGSMGAQAQSLALGIWNVFHYIALIAVNLAVMNLLPLPALDGGRILFLLVNGVAGLLFRREIPAKYEGYVHVAGMIALLALMAVVAMNDILRIVTR